MKEAFDNVFGKVADAVGIHSRFEWWAKLLFFVVLLWPGNGLVWEHIDTLDPLLLQLPVSLSVSHGVLTVVSYLIFFFLAVKGVSLYLPKSVSVSATLTPVKGKEGAPGTEISASEIISPFDFKPEKIRFKKKEDPYVQIGDMVFTEKDLYTSVLITGVTGTGKTSAAVFPMLEQIFSIYNEDGPGDLGHIGGLCLDVKGEFFEGIIYYMHRSGRNVFEDIQVIRPNCLMPIAKFKDPKTGFIYFLNAKSCSSGAEAWDLIRGKKFKDGSDIPLNIFGFSKHKLKPYEERLREMNFDVAGKKINYIGWRWQGDKLVRVSHTPAFNQTVCKLDKKGRKIVIDSPKNLVFDGITYIDNDLRYNIVEPDKPAPEAAMRLNLISTLAEGEKQSGENAYWYKRARSHIGSCIELWRLAYGDTPQCTAQAIYKITQQDDYAKKQTRIVEQKIKDLQDEADKMEDFGDKVALEREIDRMTSIVKYFSEEWGKYDSKTKTIIGSVVANAFDTFNKDPILQDSFCQPKTFSFEQCIQEGKIFVLVPGDEYETVAKILGTALKMDFQSVILSRMHRSELNQKRKIMLVNDECQKFVVAGGSQGAGDEHFMSLCRQSKCFNINATQADSWIISVVGKENSDVYLQNYNGRIWFRTNDKETAEKGEVLCGIKKQKTRSAGSSKTIHIENLLMGPKGSADHTPSFSEKEEEKPRFAKDKFYNLEMWECIMFNGTRIGADKACQSQCEPAFIGAPDGQKAVREVMRLYFQGYIENTAFKQNGGDAFNHIIEEKKKEQEEQPAALLPLDADTSTDESKEAETPKKEDKDAKEVANKESAPKQETPKADPSPTKPTTAKSSNKPNPAKLRGEVPITLLKPEEVPQPTELEKLGGDVEKLRKKAKKLCKSIELTGPRECTPDAGTIPPFQEAPNAPAPITQEEETAAPAPKQSEAEQVITPPQKTSEPIEHPKVSVPQTQEEEPSPTPETEAHQEAKAESAPVANIPLTEDGLPVIGEDFNPLNLTPAQLKKLSDDYKNNPEEMINEVLQDANFMSPRNPSEYLPAMQEEQLNDAGGSPQLAAERAALGPQGKQGGNPHLALKKGGAVNIPPSNENVYQKAQQRALEQENKLNKKALYSSVDNMQGPSVDEQTLDILKTLKPEE